jgi:hypothetical protein
MVERLYKFNDDRKKTEAEISKISMDWVKSRFGAALLRCLW